MTLINGARGTDIMLVIDVSVHSAATPGTLAPVAWEPLIGRAGLELSMYCYMLGLHLLPWTRSLTF